MANWFLEYANVGITLAVKSDEAEALILPALAGLDLKLCEKPQGITITVGGVKKKWTLADPTSEVDHTLTQDGDLLYHLTDRIVFHVADKAQGYHCVHAAAVATSRGAAVVIPAESGSGKSSFTAWLVANGFGYITDELVLIGDAAELVGIARPIQIKTRGLPAIQSLLHAEAKVSLGNFANAVTVTCLGGKFAAQRQALGAIVFPNYIEGANFSFERISSADAGMRLMSNHVNARNLEGHGFKSIMELVRNNPCYNLEYGGFDTLPTGFATAFANTVDGASV